MNYMLDTNIIIYALKGIYPSILQHFKRVPASNIFIPSIVLAELEYGARKSNNYSGNISKYRNFLSHFRTISFDDLASKYYGEIRNDLESKGCIIGGNDMLIASIALSNKFTLVTNNTSEFSRVKNLKLEDWTQ